MTQLVWDAVGARQIENGVDHGILFPNPVNGVYAIGYAWNGLTTVTESPSGGEAQPQYADNLKYVNLLSPEDLGLTIEAFTYPKQFAQCDGYANPSPGVGISQQGRVSFGLAYRTKVGNDVNPDAGYKWHLVYGCLAQPSEKAYTTVSDSPEAMTFSWELSTTPVAVTGYKPTALVTIDSTQVTQANLTALENALIGTAGTDPRLPLPDEVIGMFAGSVVSATPTAPTFVAAGGTITIPTVTGVEYRRSDTNAVVTGTVVIATVGATLVIYAVPKAGYFFPPNVDDDWAFTRTS